MEANCTVRERRGPAPSGPSGTRAAWRITARPPGAAREERKPGGTRASLPRPRDGNVQERETRPAWWSRDDCRRPPCATSAATGGGRTTPRAPGWSRGPRTSCAATTAGPATAAAARQQARARAARGRAAGRSGSGARASRAPAAGAVDRGRVVQRLQALRERQPQAVDVPLDVGLRLEGQLVQVAEAVGHDGHLGRPRDLRLPQRVARHAQPHVADRRRARRAAVPPRPPFRGSWTSTSTWPSRRPSTPRAQL